MTVKDRNPKPFFNTLQKYAWWFTTTDQRVGQFFDSFRLWLDDNGKDIFYVENDELAVLLEEYIAFLDEWASWHNRERKS